MIVRLTGGIGNQLFMYAFGRSMAELRNETLTFHWQRSTWDFGLDKFGLIVPLENPTTVPSYYTEATFSWDQRVYQTPQGTYFRGYWQSEKYFRPAALLKDFNGWLNLPVPVELPEHYVCIHVRRGDYLKSGTREVHGVFLDDYYRTAINYIKERLNNPTFVVFTDDPEMKEFLGYPVVSTNDPHEDLWEMTRFTHHILANSTFGWWGAWFSEHRSKQYSSKLIIAPKQWFVNSEINTDDLIPNRWVRL